MITTMEALAALNKIDRQKKIVNASLVSETMKKRMLDDLAAEQKKIEAAYAPPEQPPAQKTPNR